MKPDQPTLAPLGKSSIRSEVFDNLLSIEGRGTRLFSNAEAAIEETLVPWLSLILLSGAEREGRREGHLVWGFLQQVRAKTMAISDFRIGALEAPYSGRRLHSFSTNRQWVNSNRRSKALVMFLSVCIHGTRNELETHSHAEQLSHELALRFARKVTKCPFRGVECTRLTVI